MGVVSQCCSIAAASQNVGGVCGCAQIGKAAPLRNRTAGKQTVPVFVSAQGGEVFVEGPGRCSGKSRQAVYGVPLAQVYNYVPVFVRQVDAFALSQIGGFIPAPVLVD